jgi:hypothetical protein
MRISPTLDRFALLTPLFAGIFAFTPLSAMSADNEWEYKAEAYVYFPAIQTTLFTGDELELDVEDIFSNLEMTFLGLFQARKGDWAFVLDTTYLKISADEAGTTNLPISGIPTDVDVGLDLESAILNLDVSYRIYEADNFDLQIVAGPRYLSLDVQSELDASVLPGQVLIDIREHFWDAVVGVRGLGTLGDNWWMTYRFDVGAGDSEQTWNAGAQVARRFDWGSVSGGWRYQAWEFDSDDFPLIEDMNVNGPFIGFVWEF